jgi:hypothetical protein
MATGSVQVVSAGSGARDSFRLRQRAVLAELLDEQQTSVSDLVARYSQLSERPSDLEDVLVEKPRVRAQSRVSYTVCQAAARVYWRVFSVIYR